MAFVPYNFPGSFPDDFVSRITGDGIGPDGTDYVGQPGWETNYEDKFPEKHGNGVADFVDAYNGNPDLYVKVSQDHAGDGGHAGHHVKP